ncbi:MAG: 1,4-alpha-glucan branching protein GlgB [Lachnospiraceae bacterium]|nr:1,4-alpha-glucan branching protein GlgB [Lachnospiraceae bacterium]
MTKKLYRMMNWADIEGIVYSEDDNPHRLLAPQKKGANILFQFFYPGAVKAWVVIGKNKYAMELADEEGYFAVLVPRADFITTPDIPAYTYEVKMEKGRAKEVEDPYRFEPQISKKEADKFNQGLHDKAYEILGAHPKTIDGVRGVYFAVWAPNALRVSVVGDFNDWDGRFHQMRRLYDSGIFEIFVPCANVGDNYKFEVKIRSGKVFLKADPYGLAAQLRPNTASVIADLSSFRWTDEKWMKDRKAFKADTAPISVYELHLGSFAKPEGEDAPQFYNYKDLAPKIISYVKDMGYTHIELMPVMEHPLDNSWGYQTTGYFAPTARYGTPQDFQYFMNEMHKAGIGVILDWSIAHFPRDAHGLGYFDGTHLYEHADPRQGVHPHWDTLIFNYGRPEVKNFLISSAMFWLRTYHADGIRMDAVSSMLYLDYGRADGEWIPNMYGGKENLDAIDLCRSLSELVHGAKDGALLIAEESTAWPKVTEAPSEDGLGFDFKWNMGQMNDMTEYMRFDPFFRGQHHGQVTLSMVYHYSEKFMLEVSHDEVVHGKSSMIGKMPGDIPEKFANLRAFYGFMLAHPGKKLLFMGQDIGEFDEWNEERSVQWDLLTYDSHKGLQTYVKALNDLYAKYPALSVMDYDPDGFEWINAISANENVVVFLRKCEKEQEFLLIVCNFANEDRKEYRVGVPFAGKYKEILNSDAKKFGGNGFVNVRAIHSDEQEWDNRDNSIGFKMPALSVQIFSYTPFTEKELADIERRKEEDRQRQIELQKLSEATEAEKAARLAANEAKERARIAQEEAKIALKHAMEEAKVAEALEKEAKELEKAAKKAKANREHVKETAKYL